jgi:hypothetical protein
MVRMDHTRHKKIAILMKKLRQHDKEKENLPLPMNNISKIVYNGGQADLASNTRRSTTKYGTPSKRTQREIMNEPGLAVVVAVEHAIHKTVDLEKLDAEIIRGFSALRPFRSNKKRQSSKALSEHSYDSRMTDDDDDDTNSLSLVLSEAQIDERTINDLLANLGIIVNHPLDRSKKRRDIVEEIKSAAIEDRKIFEHEYRDYRRREVGFWNFAGRKNFGNASMFSWFEKSSVYGAIEEAEGFDEGDILDSGETSRRQKVLERNHQVTQVPLNRRPAAAQEKKKTHDRKKSNIMLKFVIPRRCEESDTETRFESSPASATPNSPWTRNQIPLSTPLAPWARVQQQAAPSGNHEEDYMTNSNPCASLTDIDKKEANRRKKENRKTRNKAAREKEDEVAEALEEFLQESRD